MVDASARKAASGRGHALIVAGLLFAGLFGLLQLAPAQAPDKDKALDKAEKKDEKDEKKDDKGTVGKGPTAPVGIPRNVVASLKFTIVAPGNDVPEMKKVIDEKIAAGYAANKVTPTGYCTDEEFLRRASLDIIGRIATPAEYDRYFKNVPERRRSQLIEDLLKSDDYPHHWANLWANWLLTRSGEFGRGRYHNDMQSWLAAEFALNRPYHELARKLITAKGSNYKNPEANFFLAHLGEAVTVVDDNGRPNMAKTQERVKEEGRWEMVPLTSRITRVFLGTQTQCAQCHPHPFFQSLKQEMFWGVNAFLRQVSRDPGPGMRRNNPRMTPFQELTLKDDESVNVEPIAFFETRAGKVRQQRAEFLPSGGKEKGPRLNPDKQGMARREALAEYLVEHDMFPKAMVNRMWGLFMGRGFVHPIDDFNDNNQPSNPELLDELSARFKHYNYDFKKLIRWITHSNAYHLSHVANATNDKSEHETTFSRMVMKALSPEQLFESLMTATKAEQAEAGQAKKEFKDRWLGSLINNFGDDEGNEVTFNGTIVQALMMMNGREINEAIARANKGTVALAMTSAKSPEGIINKLYIAALNRKATGKEIARIQNMLPLVKVDQRKKDTPKAAYEDLFWALLNSNEFLLNH